MPRVHGSIRAVAILLLIMVMAWAPATMLAASPSPTVVTSFQGHDWRGDLGTPADQTGAIGLDRYVELTNSGYLISSRAGVPIHSGTMTELAHITDPDTYAFDVQVNWDPSSERFYFVAIQSRQPAPDFPFLDNRLVFGFSKTASPSSASDFCVYSSDFGVYGDPVLPDYPKLGTSGDFILIGVNAFTTDTFDYVGSDLAWVAKPRAGSHCPRQGDLRSGVKQDLRDASGARLWTPVPAARYVVGDPTGWIVAIPESIYGTAGAKDQTDKPQPSSPGRGRSRKSHRPTFGSANSLYLMSVKAGAGGLPVFSVPKTLKVPQYSFPPNAPQAGTDQLLDTLDARTTQAVLSYDPTIGKLALWTQHTVFGGAGSQVRWYEIDVDGSKVARKGAVSDPKLWIFNAAITSDRVVRGSTQAYGGGFGIGFNTASPSKPLKIQMVSQAAGAEQSGIVMIRQTDGPAIDGSCEYYVYYCRWGDYAGASPDPAAPLGRRAGQVWFTNGFAEAGALPTRGSGRFWWTTWNWGAAL